MTHSEAGRMGGLISGKINGLLTKKEIKTVKYNDCLLVISHKVCTSNGYIPIRRNNIAYGNIARYIWIQAHGAIPEGMIIHHSCRRRNCIAINHLELKTKHKHDSLNHKKLQSVAVESGMWNVKRVFFEF